MAKYKIFTKEEGKPTDVKAVQVGWNMSALKYGIFWSISKKLWLYVFLIIAIFIFYLIYFFDSMSPIGVIYYWAGVHLVLSYQGNELLEVLLSRDFYKEVYADEIEADSEQEAEKIYIHEQALAEQFEEKEDGIIDGEVVEDDWFTSLIVDFGIYLLPIIALGGIIILSKLIL